MTKLLTPVPGYTEVYSTPQIPPTELPGDVAYRKAVLCNSGHTMGWTTGKLQVRFPQTLLCSTQTNSEANTVH